MHLSRGLRIIFPATVLVLAAGWLLSPHFATPTPPIPTELDQVDPEVARLIKESLDLLSERPHDPARWARLGVVYMANAYGNAAATTFGRAVEMDAEIAPWWYLLALTRFDLGEPDSALEALQRALELEATYVPGLVRLGHWRLAGGEIEKAADGFKRALKISPGHRAATLGLSRVFLMKGENSRVVVLLESHLERFPQDRYAHFLLGTAFRRLGEELRADVELSLGAGGNAPPTSDIGSDPWYDQMRKFQRGYGAITTSALALRGSGRHKEAVMLLEGLRNNYPDDITLAVNLAAAYLDSGSRAKALEILQGAAQRSPDSTGVHVNLSLALGQGGEWRLALDHAERAIQLDPGEPKARKAKARALIGARDYVGASAALVELLRLDPHDSESRVQLGALLCAIEQCAKGLEELQYATSQAPHDVRAYQALTQALIRIGDTNGARAALRRVIALDPQNSDRHALHSEIHRLETVDDTTGD